MTNSKMTRRALLTSIMALMLCFAMLTGTTFAWFTDQETSANNKIIAGNLDVELLMWDGSAYVDIGENQKPIFGEGSIAQNNNAQTLWEPGKTQIAYLAIRNAGNLALQYNVFVDVVDGGLASALEYAIVPVDATANLAQFNWADVKAVAANVSATNCGDLPVGRTIAAKGGCLDEIAKDPANVNETDYFALAIHMKEEAGNDFKNKSVTIDIAVSATQVAAELDSFDATYDEDVPVLPTDVIIATQTVVANSDTVLEGSSNNVSVKATVSKDVALVDGTEELEIVAFRTEAYNGFTVVAKDDRVVSYDIDIPAVADNNTTSITVTIGGILPDGVSVKELYHNGTPIAFEYDGATGMLTFTTTGFSVFDIVYTIPVSRWDEAEAIDTSWYNETDTEFEISKAEQLAGLAKLVDEGNTFAGKTIKLVSNIDLYRVDEEGNRVFFEPIGDASNADFSGVFDGNGMIISNLRQDCNSKHVALFGAVYEGTVKNLTIDGALIENDGSGYAGIVAAYAGASNFENITLRNSTVVNYNHNTAGIVAWCSNNDTTTTFDGINIESTTTIGSWWGSYDTRVGGIVGAMNTGNNVVIKNSTVACKLDVYNDVTSNYQWYNYRTAGMVVADVRDTITVDGTTKANPARVTCENVKVILGDWANYHYCESASYGTPSYAEEGEYKFRRVEAGLGYGGIDLTSCSHADDETHNELIAFNFLFGARDGKGIYGISSFDGVTVTYEN